VTDLARREIKRQRLLELFKHKEPIWKDEDHPELKDGAAAWVRKIRAESEARFQKIQKRRDRM
jgi:molybdopterin synthase catalytic subunit